MTPVAEAIAATIARYEGLYGDGAATAAFRLFLNSTELPASRANLAGHATGSALVWHPPSHKVLRVYHAKLDRWVFSAGGHIEEGEMPWQASRRELAEETGVQNATLIGGDGSAPVPLILDAHPIPASTHKGEPAHWHYDMVYLYRVDEVPQLNVDPSEVSGFRWVDIGDVTRANAPVDLAAQLQIFIG